MHPVLETSILVYVWTGQIGNVMFEHFWGSTLVSKKAFVFCPDSHSTVYAYCPCTCLVLSHGFFFLQERQRSRMERELIRLWHMEIAALSLILWHGASKLTFWRLDFLKLGGIQTRRISLGSWGSTFFPWTSVKYCQIYYEMVRMRGNKYSLFGKEVVLELWASPEERSGETWKWYSWEGPISPPGYHLHHSWQKVI